MFLTSNDERHFAFLTTEPNAEVGAIHPKAMPGLLTTPAGDCMTAASDEALKLQRPLPDGTLKLVAWRQGRSGRVPRRDRPGRYGLPLREPVTLKVKFADFGAET